MDTGEVAEFCIVQLEPPLVDLMIPEPPTE
jgi:hypothetical protein